MSTPQKIEWLLDSESSTSEFDLLSKKIEIPYPSQVAKGYSEHYEILKGITLIQDRHEFISEDRPATISLGKFKAEFFSPQLAIQTMHSGCFEINDNLNYSNSKLTPDLDIFSKVKYFDIDQIAFTEENIFASLLLISEEQILNLFGHESAEELFKNLDLLKLSDCNNLYIPPRISDKVKNCIPDSLEGNMRSLYAQSMIFQYLLDLNTYIGSTEGFLMSIKSTDFDVDQLHSDLLKVTTEIPTLSTLSKKYNVSPIYINQSFIRKYNQSIYSFLSHQRLEQARNALLTTDITMKTLAHKIGYSHVNYFIAAFKKNFGITPGSIKN